MQILLHTSNTGEGILSGYFMEKSQSLLFVSRVNPAHRMAN